MREIRPIIEYENLYHFDEKMNIINSRSGLMKKCQLSSCGYFVIDLYKNKTRKTELVHRLIAKTFIPNPANRSDVNHIDGNKLNNNLENLEWATRSENIQHCYDKLNRRCWLTGRAGVLNHNSKKIIVFKNGLEVAKFASIMDAERELLIKNPSIVNALKGRSKTAGGFTYKYA